METINNLVLRDESIYPTDSVLKDVLGDSFEAYNQLLKIYNENGFIIEWRYYNDGKAWLCKVQKKKKTIVWMSAWEGFMKATIYYPVRLLDNIFSSGISAESIEIIKNTISVGKSQPCIFEIRNNYISEDFLKVMQIKCSS